MEPYNTVTAAEKLGVSPATISRWAKRLSLGKKLGPSLLLSERDLQVIADSHHNGPGNPHFGKND
jgi:transposase